MAQLKAIKVRMSSGRQQRRLRKMARRKLAGHIYVRPEDIVIEPERAYVRKLSFRALRDKLFGWVRGRA